MKVKINQLREEVEECVRSLDLERAQTLKKELEELEQESSMIDLNFSTSEEVCLWIVLVTKNCGYLSTNIFVLSI